ncbi:MAG TPA: wax ester/triacylglycerol synthase family O-acyltransferase [Nevskia sp.]|nr:wax ester/triacylglycerol synthase family O-acyltransferase [Nevskia sp.]
MKQLSGLDSMFLNLETASVPMHFGGLILLDLAHAPPGFGFEAVRQRIGERLHLLPGLRRRLVGMPLNLVPPFWIEDPDFRIEHHVQRLELAAPGRDAQLAELVAELAGKPLPRERPLWAFYYVEGLSRRRAACISIIHHACIDGVSGAELLGRLLDLAPEPAEIPPPAADWDPDELPLVIDRLLFTARQAWSRQRQFVGLLRSSAPAAWHLGKVLLGKGAEPSNDAAAAEPGALATEGAPLDPLDAVKSFKPAPRTRFNVAIDSSRSYAFRSLPLARIKALKNAQGITVNDVVLALCAGALRQYLLEKDELPQRPLVAAVPISVRGRAERQAGGNRVALLTAELPTQYADPLQRVAAVSRSTAKLKRVHRAVPARLLMDWVELPAPALMARAARLYQNFIDSDRLKPPVNVLISNIPGPPVPLYLAGAPVLGNYPISIPYHGLALNITVLSFHDQLDIGLTACRDAVPDLPHLMDLLAAALDELEQAAGIAPQPRKKGAARAGGRGGLAKPAKSAQKHAQ